MKKQNIDLIKVPVPAMPPEIVSKARNKMAGFLAGWRHAVSVRRASMEQSADTEQ
ncbi:hypothetical protein ACLB1Q_33185 [Escherichia coli]